MGSLDYCIFPRPHHPSCSAAYNLYSASILILFPFYPDTEHARATPIIYYEHTDNAPIYILPSDLSGSRLLMFFLLHRPDASGMLLLLWFYSRLVHRHAGSPSRIIPPPLWPQRWWPFLRSFCN